MYIGENWRHMGAVRCLTTYIYHSYNTIPTLSLVAASNSQHYCWLDPRHANHNI